MSREGRGSGTYMEGLRNLCRELVGKPEAKRPFVTPRRRWKDNTKMDLKCD
jgi:hypothetical protein